MKRFTSLLASAFLAGSLTQAADKKKEPPPQAAKMLEGLGVAVEAPKEKFASPAEAKVNRGAPRLNWGSEGKVMSNLTRSSWTRPGWVQLKGGEKLECSFSVKAKKKTKDEFWTFAGVEIQTKGSPKRKLEAAEVEDFGYRYSVQDYMAAAKYRNGLKNPASKFTEGTLTLKNGKVISGLVAMKTTIADGGVGHGFAVANEQGEVTDYEPEEAKWMTQNRDGVTYDYVSFRGGIVPATVNGKHFLLFQNPYPTTKATGFLAGVTNMAVGMAADQAGKLAAREQMKGDLKNGKDLVRTAEDGKKTYDGVSNHIGSASDAITKDEFVIRNLKTGAEVIVTDKSVAENMMPLLKACAVTSNMNKDEIKDLTKIKNLEKLVRTLDSCF